MPALLPSFDLTPWTGWSMIGEYDVFSLATIGILLVRAPPEKRDVRMRGVPGFILALSISTYLLGTALGLISPLHAPAQSDVPYLRPDNALRLAKGFLTAVLLLPFLRERLRRDPKTTIWFASGMVCGLMLVALATIVERALFPGIFNFTADYRVVATFSSMHLGGGHIGAYIALALPFASVFLVRPRLATLPVMLLTTAIASYALVVTYARTAYIAAAGSVLLLATGWIAAARRPGQSNALLTAIAGFLTLALIAFIMTSVFSTQIMSMRFRTAETDLATREQNWSEGLEIRDQSLPATLLGMGLGTYPRAAFARKHDGRTPSNFFVAQEGNRNYLRIETGVPDYFGQKLPVAPNARYHLSALVRSLDQNGALDAVFCEKLLLYSVNCRSADLKPKIPGKWERVDAELSTDGFDPSPIFGLLRRPVELSFYDSKSQSIVEIADVRFTDVAGHNVVANGDFSEGVEHWYFTDDNHLVWRMKNQYLMILFEQGILGLFSHFALVGGAVWGALRASRRGDRIGLAIAASLAAFLCSSLFDYLLEAPRISAVFYLTSFVGLSLWYEKSEDNGPINAA